MVEYEMADSGISQVRSQDGVDRAALSRREGFALAKLVQGFFACAFVRSFVKISSANARKEADNSACSVAVLSASACSSSAVRFNVPSGSAGRFRMHSNSSAPFAKALLFSSAASVVARYNIPHSLV